MRRSLLLTGHSLILLLAATLRLLRLDAQSFWNDEGNSARLSERSIRLIIEGTASDVHPPFFYLFLRGWRELAGESEFALRLPSALFALLLIALTVALGRQLLQPALASQAGLLAALLLAINPALVYYSQELRMYTLLPLLALLATVLLLQWCELPQAGVALLYSATLAAGLYTHYFFPVVFGLHLLIVLERGRTRTWLMMAAVAVLLYLPWLPFMINGLGGNRGQPQPPAAFLQGVANFALFGITEIIATPAFLATLLLLLLLSILYRPRRWPLLIFTLLPPLALLLLGASDAEFYKFLLLALPALLLLLAAVVVDLSGTLAKRSRPLRALPLLALAIMLLPIGSATWQTLTDPAYARANYRQIAERITANRGVNAAVILNAPNQWEVFTYYHRQGAPVYPLPLSADRRQVETDLAQITAHHERLYALYWGDQQQDPEGWVENWLATHTFKAAEEWVGDVRFVTYAIPAELGQPQPLAAVFGKLLQIDSVQISSGRLQPGAAIELAFEVQALSTPGERYKLFVHLLDDDGRIVAQKDSEPQPTTDRWRINQPITVNVGVLTPSDLATGRYRLIAGFYPIDDPGRRLTTGDSDAVTLTQIDIND